MRKILAALAASGVLVAGAITAAAVTDSGVAVAQETTEGEATTEAPARPERGQHMDEVLGGLVEDNVITQEQANQIKAAFEEKAAELREEFGDRGRRAPGFRDGFRRGFDIGGLLEDGVIDADELAELGSGHPLNDPEGPAADYLDGGLTQEELQEIREQQHERRGARFGPRGSGAGPSV